MSDLSPLLQNTTDELERMLLLSDAGDEPDADSMPRVATVLGVSAAALGLAGAGNLANAGGLVGAGAGTLGVGAGTGTLAAGHAAVGGSAVVKPITLASLAKLLAVGATAGVLTSGTAHIAYRATHARPEPTEVTAAPAVEPAPQRAASRPALGATPIAPEAPAPPPALIPPPPAAAAATDTDDPEAADEPEATPTGSTASFETPTESAPSRTASALSVEVRALDAVRQSLSSANAPAALAALDAYRTRFPNGALATEASVLRVEALLRTGDRTGAEREAARLIQSAPNSRHADRVRELLAPPGKK